MFMKKRMAPAALEKLPRLLRRLPETHPSWQSIYRDHYRIQAGFGGEQTVDRLLERMRWKDEPIIICDLHLKERLCQVDTVVLTPYYALVLEVKNYSGTLTFNEESFHLEQLTRDGKRIGFNSPATQAWNVREEIKILFESQNISLPVFTAIVLPYSSTLIDQPPAEIPVVYGYSLSRFIAKLSRTRKPLPHEELTRIGQFLIGQHSPFFQKPYHKLYSFEAHHLKKGILCESCGAACTKKSARHFSCKKCLMKTVNGYESALHDWFDFASSTITNAQCRDFLGLKDKYAANYLLRKMNLSSTGASNQVYYSRLMSENRVVTTDDGLIPTERL